MRRRFVLVAAVAGLILSSAAVAVALWTASGNGPGRSQGTTVNGGNPPAAVVTGRTVQLSWAASTLANGAPVTGYVVRRYDSTGLIEQGIASGTCAATVAGTTCSQTATPVGTWRYSVTPVHNSWSGAESTKTSVTVAAPTISLTVSVAKSPSTVSGTITNFIDGETIRFYLDSTSGTELAGTVNGSATPAAVPAGGSAPITVNLPSGTTEGAHTIIARASPSAETAGTPLTVDNTPPPAPTITSNPANPTNSTSASFGFTDAEPGVTFECRLDGGGYSTCTSPKSYTGLTQGSHTFEVRALDPAGNQSAATPFTWTIDTTAPTGAITLAANGASYNNTTFTAGCGTPSTGDFCGTASDTGGAGVSTVQVSILRVSTARYWNAGPGQFNSSGENLYTATGTTTWSYAFLATNFPGEESYTLRAVITDAAGNTASVSSTFTIDRTAPPAPSITSQPSNPSASSSPSFSFTDAEPGVAFECQLDGGGYSSCTSPKSYAGLTDGSHTFSVRAVDAAGNTSGATSYTWSIDTTGPSTAVTFPASGSSYSSSGYTAGCGTPATGDLCGTASDANGVSSVQVSIRRVSTGNYWNGSTFGSASEVLFAATGTTSWSYTFAAGNFPADGNYTVRAVATDGLGNTGSASSTFTIDTTAPTAAITFPASGSSYSSSGYTAGCGTPATGDLCGTASDANGVSSVQVSIRRVSTGNYWNGSTFSSASEVLFSATGTTSWSYTFAVGNFPADGNYTVRAVATDAAGNTGSASSTFTLDVTAPSATDVQTANGGTPPQNVVGRADKNDSITFTYSEQIDPVSILAGWNGSSTNVVVRITDGGAGNDVLTVWNSANTAQLPLGSVNLGRTDYVTANSTFGASGQASTMVQSGSSITVTFGNASGSFGTVSVAAAMTWTPSATATDLAGNPCSTTPATESGAADVEF